MLSMLSWASSIKGLVLTRSVLQIITQLFLIVSSLTCIVFGILVQRQFKIELTVQAYNMKMFSVPRRLTLGIGFCSWVMFT